MDPDAVLTEALRTARRITDAADRDEPQDPDDAVTLATAVEDLSGWLTRGGHAPSRWRRWQR